MTAPFGWYSPDHSHFTTKESVRKGWDTHGINYETLYKEAPASTEPAQQDPLGHGYFTLVKNGTDYHRCLVWTADKTITADYLTEIESWMDKKLKNPGSVLIGIDYVGLVAEKDWEFTDEDIMI